MPTPLRLNPLNLWDSYKDSHDAFFKVGTSELYYYYSARGGEFTESSLFGLQYNLKSVFEGQFFTQDDLDEAYEDSQLHMGKGFAYNYAGWQHILDKHSGRLPVEIKAVKEGIPVPVGNVMFTIRSTDPVAKFLPGCMETVLQHAWYGSAVTTKSREVKKIIKQFLEETADDLSTLPFQLHDFGFRGVTVTEQAALGGAAHLVNFLGTDTKPANALLHQFYRAPRISGFSVPATEHSTTTSWGRNGEGDSVANALKKYPTGILSLVADSYDVYNFVENIIGGRFRDEIKYRVGKVVVRPDSGDFNIVVPKILDILASKFGFEVNSKGYKVLPPCIGVIWGDGMDLFTIKILFNTLKNLGWSASVLTVGMGGGLLQKVNRDTQKVAIKCSAGIIDGVEVEVYKDPITDPGKSSKRGRLALVSDDEGYRTIQRKDLVFPLEDQLETVFLNGDVTRTQTLEEIRYLAAV